jgi:Bax protein
MHKKNNSGEALEPALPWANVPLFAPAMALLGSAAIAVSALAIFAPADLRMVTHTAPAPALVVQTPATPPAINFLALIGTSTNSAGPAAIEAFVRRKVSTIRVVNDELPAPAVAVQTRIVSPAIPLPTSAGTRTDRVAIAKSFVRGKVSAKTDHGKAFQNVFASKFAPVSFEMPADETFEASALFAGDMKAGRGDFLPAPVKPRINGGSVATTAINAAIYAAIQLPPPKPSGKKPVKAALFASAPRDGHIGSVAALDAHFKRINYDLANVRELGNNVPRLYLTQLPDDIADIASVATRKRVFIKAILPVILRVNEDILAARERLLVLRGVLDSGMSLNDNQRKWLYEMAERYETDPYDWEAFLARVDIIPPSLAIAQAAEESGWGTSRFARDGNALFGQYTFAASNGMLPEERANGEQHLIRAYSSLVEGVRSYMHNLNYHRAYGEFRGARKWLRDHAKPIDGNMLAGELLRYSERGAKYVKTIRRIMRANDLAPLDDARLHTDRWTRDDPSGKDHKS